MAKIRMAQPEFNYIELISKAEYEAARRLGTPASVAPWGFLEHNTCGVALDRHFPGQTRTLHKAYLHFGGENYYLLLEPLTDQSFQALKLHNLMIGEPEQSAKVTPIRKRSAT